MHKKLHDDSDLTTYLFDIFSFFNRKFLLTLIFFLVLLGFVLMFIIYKFQLCLVFILILMSLIQIFNFLSQIIF